MFHYIVLPIFYRSGCVLLDLLAGTAKDSPTAFVQLGFKSKFSSCDQRIPFHVGLTVVLIMARPICCNGSMDNTCAAVGSLNNCAKEVLFGDVVVKSLKEVE